jgi:hypothetical protein
MMSIFHNRYLYKYFKYDIDYKEFDNILVETGVNLLDNFVEQDSPVHGGQNRNHYFITPRCFKKILMLVRTEKSYQLIDYYIKIEDLSMRTYEIINVIKDQLIKQQLSLSLQQLSIKDQQLSIKDEELSLERSKNKKLSDIVSKKYDLTKNQYIYIACNRALSSENRFKVGGVKSKQLLTSRLATYNSALPKDDLMLYPYVRNVNKYTIIEDTLRSLIPNFLDKPDSTKEIYHIYYHDLVSIIDFICDNSDKSIDFINTNIRTFTDNISSKTYIPLHNSDVIICDNNKISKIDISKLTEDKSNELISNIISKYIQDKSTQNLMYTELVDYIEKQLRNFKRSYFKKNIQKFIPQNVNISYK